MAPCWGRNLNLIFYLLIISVICVKYSLCLFTTRSSTNEPIIFNKNSGQASGEWVEKGNLLRNKRDAQVSSPQIKHWISHLNVSHQQLMVHWVGAGSDVVICVARNGGESPNPIPSAVFISYDYANTFENKTDLFALDDSKTRYAALDRFIAHPKFLHVLVFIDVTNMMIFVTKDEAVTISRYPLDFHPSELLFDDSDPSTFLVLDKVDPSRRLWLTRDLGISWEVVQESVKSVYFSVINNPVALLPSVVSLNGYKASADNNTLLFVLRKEPNGKGTIISSPTLFSGLSGVLKVWLSNVDDLVIKGDFMFATQSDSQGRKELFISYKRGPFVRGVFYTELERRHYFIADVSDGQVFVVAGHTDTMAHLYTSLKIDSEKVTFGLSLERIFCYFPNGTWHDSWIGDTTEDVFADIYKVEGLRGIYIASHVVNTTDVANIGPQHLQTVITFDRGGEWRPVQPPLFDDNGQPIKCEPSAGCSLHLSQRFSQLHPQYRATPIMSSAAAPGIILATGTIGKSLKGRPGVFLSRDGGLTWRQILKDFFFFNFGDHGGILTAIRCYRNDDETRELLYSTDEGENFESLTLNVTDDLKVYGLMTEPGFNTTVFLMFGSLPGHHQWLTVKVDMRDIFPRNCTDDDYKFWSPHSESGLNKIHVGCVLGRKETYQRRIASSNCYNGRNYERPISIEVCECDAEDFICDEGFERNYQTEYCFRDVVVARTPEPYSPPKVCPPGSMYNRTKGYRRIPGDVCKGGREDQFMPDRIPCPIEEKKAFLLVARRNSIARVDLDDDVMSVLPLENMKNVIAVEFDMKNNCIYWADIVRDWIQRQCFGNGVAGPEILVDTGLTSIEGMALDWVSNVLFFLDGVAAKISVVRTDVDKHGRMRTDILQKPTLIKPRGIAVHPKQGFLFWTDWDMTSPSVSRSNLDGSDVRHLFRKPIVEWPNGLTIDHIAERLYWADARQDYIGSSDLYGNKFIKVISNDDRVTHPFAVAVFKDRMYWDDWKKNSIFSADKDRGLDVHVHFTNLPGLMDLKIFAHSIQEGTNACSGNHNCSHICLGAPGAGNYSCICPNDMILFGNTCLCPGRQLPGANGICPVVNSKCDSGFFKCPESICIPKQWMCDGEPDCRGGADEIGCKQTTCKPKMHMCNDGTCISNTWVCDHDPDCPDGSDESNCTFPECSANQFRCENGRCISKQWKCDQEDDCFDMSDELGCNVTMPFKCRHGEFQCLGSNKCIPTTWKCDGDRDCQDGYDEEHCSAYKCHGLQFQCENRKCIMEMWRCDGEDDCGDGSDEVNCEERKENKSSTLNPSILGCYDWTFKCNSSNDESERCIPYWWKCDGVNDCADKSDEMGCSDMTSTPPPFYRTTPSTRPFTCKAHQYQCPNGECIQQAWVCDGMKDCEHGEDEMFCHEQTSCASNEFRCRLDGSCVSVNKTCDGISQCPDGSDEEDCNHHSSPKSAGPSCAPGFFSCDMSACIPLSLRCNNHTECYDGTDEINCLGIKPVYQVLEIIVDPRIESTKIYIYWKASGDVLSHLDYMPAIAKVNESKEGFHKWLNSSWTRDNSYWFLNLQPFTDYNITVFVRNTDTYEVYLPVKFVTATTDESIPMAPRSLNVSQISDTSVFLRWMCPENDRGRVKSYKIFTSPPEMPEIIYLSATPNCLNELTMVKYFRPGTVYTFWVTASSNLHEGPESEKASLTIKSMRQGIHRLWEVSTTDTSVQLQWTEVPGVEKYYLRFDNQNPTYPHVNNFWNTSSNSITVKDLSPSVTYNIAIFDNPKYEGELLGFIRVKTHGSPHVRMGKVRVKRGSGRSLRVSWDKYENENYDTSTPWTYGLYYGTSMNNLLQGAKVRTNDLSVDVLDTEPCESYLFSVGVLAPKGPSPIGQLTKFLTAFDVNAAPRKVVASQSPTDENTMVIKWFASCSWITEPVGYVLMITDVHTNRTTRIQLMNSTEVIWGHSIKTLYGGSYKIEVKTTGPKAVTSYPIFYNAPKIPAPISMQFRNKNGSFVLEWAMPYNLPEDIKSYQYEVMVSQGLTLNKSTMHVYQTGSPSFVLTNVAEEGIYSFAVKLVTSDGRHSDPSEVVPFYAPGSPVSSASEGGMSVWGVLVTCFLVLLVSGSALALLIMRQRRQRPFAIFANTRYDRRSGATTFGGEGLALAEDEDSPVIRGFSDDEPLVIA